MQILFWRSVLFWVGTNLSFWYIWKTMVSYYCSNKQLISEPHNNLWKATINNKQKENGKGRKKVVVQEKHVLPLMNLLHSIP